MAPRDEVAAIVVEAVQGEGGYIVPPPEFLRELRSSPRLRLLPVVLTTVEPDGSAMLEEAKGLGVTAVVKKPWKPQHLKHVVQTACSAPGR